MRRGQVCPWHPVYIKTQERGTRMTTCYVGIDIAAYSAAVAWSETLSGAVGSLSIEQTPAGYATLCKQLPTTSTPQETLVVMEATGTYWLGLAWYLHERGYQVSVLNPAQARHFARMQLQRTKTDALDAHLLMDFGRLMNPPLWTPPPAICEQLQQRLALREDLLQMRCQDRNRRHALQQNPHADPAVLARLEQHIAYLKSEIQALEAEIKTLLAGQHAWQTAAQHLLSIIGIGLITAAWILVATHAFARCDSPEQAACFAGLAPHARDSGTSLRGRRSVGHGGHAALRRNLYMAAGSAVRFNKPVKHFYDRLLDRGKPKMVARLAAARKLLHIAWAVVVKDCDFDPDYTLSLQSMASTP
jgi:transposase